MTEAHRLTVNLVPKASDALDHAAEALGLSKTDTLNRALQVHDWFLNEKAKGNRVLIKELDGGVTNIEFL